MSKQTRILLFGNSLVLGGIATSLLAEGRFEVVRLSHPVLHLGDVDALAPDVVIFDTETPDSASVFSVLENHPDLLLLGVSSSGRRRKDIVRRSGGKTGVLPSEIETNRSLSGGGALLESSRMQHRREHTTRENTVNKTLVRVAFVAIVALTLLLGLAVTADARPAAGPNDQGFLSFSFNYATQDDLRYFADVRDFIDNSTYGDVASIEVDDPGPFGYFEYPTENYDLYWLEANNTSIESNINWGKGLATFKSEDFDLVVDFNPREVTRTVDKDYGIIAFDYSGVVTVTGTVTVDCGDDYQISITAPYGHVTEWHTLPMFNL